MNNKILRHFLLVTLFFGVIFIAKAVYASNALAVGITGMLLNTSGSIDVTVTVNFYDNGNTYIGQQVVPVTKGTSAPVTKTDGADTPTYKITWSTACDSGTSTNIPGSGGNYTFSDQDVHCTKTNSTVSISSAACPANNGSVSWDVKNIGTGGSNIVNFKIYKSLGGNPDSDTQPLVEPYVAGTNSYTRTQGLTNLTAGNWNIKVKAFTNAPDNYSVADSVVMSCGAGLTAPSGLNVNVTCDSNNNKIRVDFGWGAAQTGTFNYEMQYNPFTDPGLGGNWPAANKLVPNPATLTVVTANDPIINLYSTQYYWRVKATRQTDGAVTYSASANFTTPSTCSGGAFLSPSIRDANAFANTCAPNSIDYDWDRADENWYSWNVNPDNVMFRWRRATPLSEIVANQEFIDVSTDPTFLSGVIPFNVYNSSTTIQDAAAKVNYAFVDGTTYYWRIRTKMTDGKFYVSEVKPFIAPSQCNISGSDQIILDNVSAYCLGTDSIVRLRWRLSDNLIYALATKSTLTNGTGATFAGEIGYNDEFVIGPSGYGVPRVYSVGHYFGQNGGYLNPESNKITVTPLDCSANGALNPPSGLDSIPALTCNYGGSGELGVTFQWVDQSNNETGYIIDVSTEPFTGDATTNPSNSWGRKTITVSAPDIVNTGKVWSYVWKKTAVNVTTGPLDVGDANPADPATALEPLEATTYFWRVRATNVGSQSIYKYPDGTDGTTSAGSIYPSGAPFTTSYCSPRYDLSLSVSDGGGFKNWNDQGFDVSEIASLELTVINRAGYQISTVPAGTVVYFYYRGGSMPSCPGTPKNTVPVGGEYTPDKTNKAFKIPVALDPGQTYTIPIKFNVGTIVGSFTAHAYVTPSCTYATGTEINTGGYNGWTNNKTSSGFSYTVGVNKFFQTIGGDVGALRSISVGLDSTDTQRQPSPPHLAYTQSDYTLLGASVDPKVRVNSSAGGYRISNYPNGKMATGIFDYLNNKFRSKATLTVCAGGQIQQSSLNTDGIYFCSGNTQIASDLTVNCVCVIFIDNGNLDIRGNVTASGSKGVVFVVGGDVTANNQAISPVRIVTDLDGVYVARGIFHDNGGAAGGTTFVGGSAHRLKVNGGVYADGGFDLGRYFSTGGSTVFYNSDLPVDIFSFDPKYLLIFNSYLTSSPVGWAETNP